ncbi:MAG: hypothetical protein LBE38_01670 [Deltaproteobacteria bacterium]|jgi:NDP-sugar pyrophosphorylase family protein|nr:hypothetical protein [Deltaproteobacteria bacterium]
MHKQGYIDTAMLLSAGLGTRLLPLSQLRPKCLFPILNRPILGFWLEKLKNDNIKRVIINVHHLAGLIEEFVEKERSFYPQMEIIISREETVLGTGGGLKKARELLPSTFLVVNSDIYSDLNLALLLAAHREHGPLATLAVLKANDKATVAVGDNETILGFRREGLLPGEVARLCGSGVMVMENAALEGLPDSFSDIIAHLDSKILLAGAQIKAYLLPETVFWKDMGTVEDYYALNYQLAKGGHFIESGASILGESSGFLAAEAGSRTLEGSWVGDCILWSTALVERGARLCSMVVAGKAASGVKLTGGIISGGNKP